MGTFNAGAIEANLTLGRTEWTADLRRVKQEIEDLDGTVINVVVRLSDTDLQQDLRDIRSDLEVLDNMRADVQVGMDDAAFRRGVNGVLGDMAVLERLDVDIDVDLHSEQAIDDMIQLVAMTKALDGSDIDIDVDYNEDSLKRLVGGGGSGGGGYLSFWRILIYAILALMPLLLIASSAASAALVGFVGAIVAAIGPVGVLALGLIGLVNRFNDLDPSERTDAMNDFADSLESITDAYNEFLDGISDAGFGLMAQSLELVAKILPTLVPLFNATAEMLGGVLDSIEDFVDSSEYQEMLDFFGGFGVDMLESFLVILGNLILFFGRLFDAMAPFISTMMEGLEEATAGWAAWARDLENNDAFQRWVENALEYGPMIFEMLGALGSAIYRITEALEPFAGPMIEILTAAFEAIAEAPVEVIQAVAIGFAAWRVISVLIPLVSGLAAVLPALGAALTVAFGPVGLIVAGVAALAFVVWQLWQNNEQFRERVIEIWTEIQENLMVILEAISVFWEEHGTAITEKAIEVWEQVQATVSEAVIILLELISQATEEIAIIWENWGTEILYVLSRTIDLLLSSLQGFFQVIQGIFQAIKGAVTGDWRTMWEGVQNIMSGFLKPIRSLFNSFGIDIDNILDNIRGYFDSFVGFVSGLPGRIAGAASGMWNGITSAFRGMVSDIQSAWNNLSFTIDIPDVIPGLPNDFTISTPNIPFLAEGGYIDSPTLAMVGEGGEPEIVAPERKIRAAVEQAMAARPAQPTGFAIDSETLVFVLANAFSRALREARMVTTEDLQKLIEAAGVNVEIDARGQNNAAEELAQALAFEMRVLGYGGVNA